MPQRFKFPEREVVDLEEFEPEPIRPSAVRIKTEVSLLSPGTEGICFLQRFEPRTHWEDWVKYPFYPGYSTVGRVVEIGSEVSGWQPGQRVVARTSHASEALVDAALLSTIPDGVSDEDAAWFALAVVGFMGAKNGGFRLGDSIAIVGAGPVGQIVLRWAVACGARHAVSIDPIPGRLQFAEQGGATATVCGALDDVIPTVVEACGGARPRVVVDATGHPRVFEQCLALPRDRGVVVILGDTGFPSEQRLSRHLIRRGLQVIGAHGSHEEGEWTQSTIDDLFFSLLLREKFNLAGLITHRLRPEECKAAYDLVAGGGKASMGILFDWR